MKFSNQKFKFGNLINVIVVYAECISHKLFFHFFIFHLHEVLKLVLVNFLVKKLYDTIDVECIHRKEPHNGNNNNCLFFIKVCS